MAMVTVGVCKIPFALGGHMGVRAWFFVITGNSVDVCSLIFCAAKTREQTSHITELPDNDVYVRKKYIAYL